MQYPITLKMADGTDKQFWLSDEKLQFGGGSDNAVTDVSINGNSIVMDGVANIPLAGENKAGAYNPLASYGLTQYGNNSGLTQVYPSEISSRSGVFGNGSLKAITPRSLDAAVKAAMCDGKGQTWSSDERLESMARIGICGKNVDIITATLEQPTKSFTVELPANKEYVFAEAEVSVPPGAQVAGPFYASITKKDGTGLYRLYVYTTYSNASGTTNWYTLGRISLVNGIWQLSVKNASSSIYYNVNAWQNSNISYRSLQNALYKDRPILKDITLDTSAQFPVGSSVLIHAVYL